MPFKRANTNEDHLPASQRDEASPEADVEGHMPFKRAAKGEDYLPPAERAASDDGESDTEGQDFVRKF